MKKIIVTILSVCLVFCFCACGSSFENAVHECDFHNIHISVNDDYRILTPTEMQDVDEEMFERIDFSDDSILENIYEDEMFVEYYAGANVAIACFNTDEYIETVYDLADEICESNGSSAYTSEVTIDGKDAITFNWGDVYSDGSGWYYQEYYAFQLGDEFYVITDRTIEESDSRNLDTSIITPVLEGITINGETGNLNESDISWDEVGNHYGEEVSVVGEICSEDYADDEEGCPFFYDIGEAYPSKNRFVVVLWENNQDNFRDGDLPNVGDTIRIKGKIEKYGDVYQIELVNNSQITLLKRGDY